MHLLRVFFSHIVLIGAIKIQAEVELFVFNACGSLFLIFVLNGNEKCAYFFVLRVRVEQNTVCQPE